MGMFGIILVPCVAIIKLKGARTHKKHKKYKLKNRFERVIQILLNILIPGLVVVNHNIAFFVLISILLLWKVANFFKNMRAYNILEKIIKTITTFSWLIYHICFFAFFIFNYVSLDNR